MYLSPLPTEEVSVRRVVQGYEGVMYSVGRAYMYTLDGRGLRFDSVPEEAAADAARAHDLLLDAERALSLTESRRVSAAEASEAVQVNGAVVDQVLIIKKAATTAHHAGYTRRDPRTGKLEHVSPLGYTPEKPPPRETKHYAAVSVNADVELESDDELGHQLLAYLIKRQPKNEKQLAMAVESFVDDSFDIESAVARKKWLKTIHSYLAENGIAETADADEEAEGDAEQDAWSSRKAQAKLQIPVTFKPRGTKLLVNGQPVSVSADVEQACYAYAKRFLVKGGTVKDQTRFVRNFESSLRKLGVPKGDISYKHFVAQAKRDLAAPVSKKGGPKDESPQARPDLYVKQDGVMTRVIAATLPTGGFYTGKKGYGTWVPPVREEDLVLNVSPGGAPAGWRGKVINDPSKDFYLTWEHPVAKKRGYVYMSRKQADLEKFFACTVLSKKLQDISDDVFRDITGKSTPAATKAAALCVMLIDQHHFRVGNETFAKQGTYGVASFRAKHVKIDGTKVTFEFIAKKQEPWKREVDFAGMPSALAFLKSCMKGKKPDDRLWSGADWSASSKDVNEYLAPYSSDGVKITAKSLRTYHANRHMTGYLRKLEEAQTAYKLTDVEVRKLYKGVKLKGKDAALLARKAKKDGPKLADFLGFVPYVGAKGKGSAMTGVLPSVAAKMGHTTGACRNNYIDPVVVTRFAMLHGWDDRTPKERKSREDLPGYEPDA